MVFHVEPRLKTPISDDLKDEHPLLVNELAHETTFVNQKQVPLFSEQLGGIKASNISTFSGVIDKPPLNPPISDDLKDEHPLLVNELAYETTFINQPTTEYTTLDMPKESPNHAMGNHIANPQQPQEQISMGSENSIRKDIQKHNFGKTKEFEELRKYLTLFVGKEDYASNGELVEKYLNGWDILEVLYKYGSSKDTSKGKGGGETLSDMLLLNKQIPFPVLFRLHKWRKDNDDNDVALLEELIELVKNCYEIHVGKLTPLNAHRCKCKYTPGNFPKNLLEVVHTLCGSDEYCGLGLQQQIKTATELKNNGVSLEKNDEEHTLFDIHFKEGTIKIRGFNIDEFTETFLRSMIAYEQHSDVASKPFTDFVLFMTKLINTPKDAELLYGIIGNFNGREQLFSELRRGVKASSTSTFQEVGDCAIDITEDNQTKNGGAYIIPRVDEALSKTNPSAYKPMRVSIGPYYRIREPGSENDIKKQFQKGFLGNTKGLEEKCLKKLANIVDQARSYYSTDSTKDMSNEEFVEMLMVDGCFILEFLKSVKDKKSSDNGRAQSFMEKERNVVQTLKDMLLLENQIPFFVLFELHKLKQDKGDDVAFLKELIELVKNCYESQVLKLTLLNALPCKYSPGNLPKHLLEVVHCLCIPTNTTRSDEYDEEYGVVLQQINTATELEKVGVSFQKIEVHRSLFDIDFNWWGTMKIRCFRIDDFTETFLRNMIAYEQHSDLVAFKYFTDFVLFMSHLIHTPEDAKLLCGKGIIANFQTTDDKEKFFSQLLVGVHTSSTSTLSTLSGVIDKVSQHCEKALKICMGVSRQYLTDSPWAPILSIVAVIAALVTVVHYIKS